MEESGRRKALKAGSELQASAPIMADVGKYSAKNAVDLSPTLQPNFLTVLKHAMTKQQQDEFEFGTSRNTEFVIQGRQEAAKRDGITKRWTTKFMLVGQSR